MGSLVYAGALVGYGHAGGGVDSAAAQRWHTMNLRQRHPQDAPTCNCCQLVLCLLVLGLPLIIIQSGFHQCINAGLMPSSCMIRNISLRGMSQRCRSQHAVKIAAVSEGRGGS